MSLTGSENTFVWPEEDLALPKGSLILVTGATGYIANHIINEALKLGYRVRGTVRSEEKGEGVKKVFDNEDFETAVVTDLTDEHGFDKAMEGVDGIIHAATVVSFSSNPHEVVPVTVAGAVNILKSAKKAGTVKRVVYISSSVAATMPIMDKKFTIDKTTWNQSSVDKANAMTEPYKEEDGYDVYGASKTEAERAVWKFVEDEKPDFVVNTVLPNANIGTIISNAGVTASIAPAILKGEYQFGMFPPQWYVDVADDAKVNIAALIDKTVANDRIYAFAETFDFNDIIEAVRKARPESTTISERQPPHGKDLSEVDNTQGADLLRKWFGQDGWKRLEESVKDNLEGM